MKRALLFLVLLLLSNQAGAELYQHVQISLSGPVAFQRLAGSGISLEEGVEAYVGGIRLTLSESEIKRVRDLGFRTKVLNPDMEGFYRSRLVAKRVEKSAANFANGSMGGNFTYAEVIDKLQAYRTKYGRIFSQPQTIGHSIEGRPIVAFKISDNPDTEETEEPEVLYTALHHAREPQSLMSLIYFVEQLLKKYGRQKEVTYLVDNRQLWFVPVVNPDGYVYNQQTNPAGGGLWRKNRRNTSGFLGVDLNRNYGFQWGLNDSGSSPHPATETYRGEAPFSEPETQAIREFVVQRRFVTAFNNHSYYGAFLYSWSYTPAKAPDYKIFRAMTSQFSLSNGYLIGNNYEVLQYTSNGEADDWFYGDTAKFQTFSFTPEIGYREDGFWPSSDRIVYLAKGTYASHLDLAWMAGGFPYYKNDSWSEIEGDGDGAIEPGEKWQLRLRVGNLGRTETLEDVSVQVKKKVPHATVEAVDPHYGSLAPFRSRAKRAFNIVFSPDGPLNQIRDIPIYFYSGTTLLRKDAVYVWVNRPGT